ncbi:MAG: ATP-binding protein [Alphaproteobacteria bacterium]|jgi:signal transduction histidine kinase|nr:ATP-binding protein [Alphaproteobacteria bacterium]MDP6567672.1 ATP-binding protein [Alphaproteobacteria bacterium]
MSSSSADTSGGLERPASIGSRIKDRGLPRRLTPHIYLMTGLLALSLVMTALLLLWAVWQQDRVVTDNARHLADRAIHNALADLGATAIDYSYWDEAYENINAAVFDRDWGMAEFGDAEYLTDHFGITTAVVISGQDRILFQMRDGVTLEAGAEPPVAVQFGAGFDKLMAQARGLIKEDYGAATGIVAIDGELHLAALSVVRPGTEALAESLKVWRKTPALVVLMTRLGEDFLAAMARDFNLSGLAHESAESDPDDAQHLPLRAADGSRRGSLVWRLVLPSEGVLGVVMPTLLATLLGLAALGFYLSHRLRRGEEAVFWAIREAQEADRTKTEFLANISHELRTPLNAIVGFSETMNLETFGPLGNDRYREYCGLIQSSGRLLTDILNDLLDLSRIEAGKLELEEEELVLTDLCDDVKAIIRSRAVEKSIAVENRLPRDLPRLIADQRAMKQVLLNLLVNAIKFTPKGGEIVLSGELLRNGDLELTVSDNGIGIPQDQLRYVMQPFNQIATAYSRDHGGAGLGLPLVASLINLHGGTVDLDSVVGKGTDVRLRLPKDRLLTG